MIVDSFGKNKACGLKISAEADLQSGPKYFEADCKSASAKGIRHSLKI